MSAQPLTEEERVVLTDAEVFEWLRYRHLVDPEFRRAAVPSLGLLKIPGGEIVYTPQARWRKFLTRVSDVRERPVRWLWRDRIPHRTTTIVTGVGGLAKSQVLIGIAGEATRGELTGRPETVIYFSAEDDPESVLVPRMRAAGVDRDRAYTLTVGRDFLLSEEDFGQLEEMITSLGAALVVFDPLVAYLDRGTDSWKTQDVRLVLKRLQGLASSLDVTFLAVIHFKKGQERDVLHRISGAAGFGDACRSALAAAPNPRDDGDGFVLVHAKSNYGPVQPALRYHVQPREWESEEGLIRTSRAVFDGEDQNLTERDVFERRPGPDPEARDRAGEFLMSWLRDGPVDSREIEKAATGAGISKSTLERARAEIGVEADPQRDEKGRVVRWMLRLRPIGGEVEF